jgi:hypothetical protein
MDKYLRRQGNNINPASTGLSPVFWAKAPVSSGLAITPG